MSSGTFDIIVVGSGASGYAAAVTAAVGGATVLMLEKAAERGGTSARSGGSTWIPNNRYMADVGQRDHRDGALRYLARLGFPHRFDSGSPTHGLEHEDFRLLEAFYDNAAVAIESLVTSGALHFAPRRTPDGAVMAPYPDYHEHLPEHDGVRGRMIAVDMPLGQEADFDIPPGQHIGVGGQIMITTMHRAAASLGVQVSTSSPVRSVINDEAGSVVGVIADVHGVRQRIEVRKGVVFCTGGFLHDEGLRQQYLRGPVYGGATVLSTTGDVIDIATRAGAALGNMSNAWWCQLLFDSAMRPGEEMLDMPYPFGDSMLQVNKYGHRVLNEKQIYNERTQTHFVWDPRKLEYPNLVMLQIYDEAVAQNPIEWAYRGVVPPPGEDADYILTANTLEELADNIDSRLAENAGKIGGARLDPEFVGNLRTSIRRFNEFAEAGVDGDFGRGDTAIQRHIQGTTRHGYSNPTMSPIAPQGPYHCIMLVAGALDTKGGPRIDEHARMVRADGTPIAGLYGAGNCVSSPFGQAYPGPGGTLGVAITFGYLAAKHALSRE